MKKMLDLQKFSIFYMVSALSGFENLIGLVAINGNSAKTQDHLPNSAQSELFHT
jgi:hypothetical protein